MRNYELVHSILDQVYCAGIKDICICAGARNSPFVQILEESNSFQVFNFFEERSASFFALGRSLQSQRPTVVITTSGTAVAELLPAVIESYYSGIPLIVISADRPKNYRGSGAPQAIEQSDIFQSYCSHRFDIDDVKESKCLELESWSQRTPVHINVCFSEPLIVEPLPKEFFLDRKLEDISSLKTDVKKISVAEAQRVESFFQIAKKPLLILSGVKEQNCPLIIELILKLKIPVYLECTGYLGNEKNMETIRPYLLTAGEKMVESLFLEKKLDSVIRIGSVPALKMWRRLEVSNNNYDKIPVLSFSELEFSGLAREKNTEGKNIEAIDLSSGLEHLLKIERENNKQAEVFDCDIVQGGGVEKLLCRFPESEPSFFYQLNKQLEINEQSANRIERELYLGNSMPVREMNLASLGKVSAKSFANRGANGIDGQLSTFLGCAKADALNIGVFGDLTTLYDLSAPWALQFLQETICKIVVVNNNGGQIFSQIFKSKNFINSHSIEFSDWAKMWRLPYSKIEKFESLEFLQNKRSEVIEVIPNTEQTECFWQNYKGLFVL